LHGHNAAIFLFPGLKHLIADSKITIALEETAHLVFEDGMTWHMPIKSGEHALRIVGLKASTELLQKFAGDFGRKNRFFGLGPLAHRAVFHACHH
jgi:hypothetical protein